MSTPERQNQAPFELHAFIDSIPALAWTALPDGSIECFNQKFTDYSGWSPLQIPQAWRSRGELHPDDLERFDGWWQEILESRKPAPTEVRFRRADGEYRWFQISAAPIHDAQGNLVRWCGINIDIDDRKRAEQKLQANELSLRQIIDNIPGYVHTTSAAGDVEFHNRQTLEYFGKTKEELEDWRRNDIVHPGDLPRVIDAWRKSVETGQNYDVEQRNRRADGVYRWFQARGRPVRNAEGEITAWYWLLIDIEDRKRAEEALRESEYESRLIVDTIPGQVAVLSTSGKIERLSQRILDYYGRSLEEIAQWTENENDIIHPEDRPELVRAFTHSMTTGEPGEFEPRTRRFDGPYRWFHVRWLPLRDRQGRIVRWYVLQTDIDDRKRAEQKLQQNEEELRTILDTIRQAVAMLAADGTVLYANRVALEITGAPWTTSKTIPFSWQATRTM